jgi:predicted amidohydrolase
MHVALVSLNQRWQDKDANFSRCADFARAASSHNCELVIFPEMTLTGYSLATDNAAEPELGSATLARFGELARDARLAIVFGACLFDPVTHRPRNQLCLAHADGTSQAIYAKIHPFSFAGEDKVLEAGGRLGTFSVGALRLGASICYDLRFPEMYAAMAPVCSAAIAIANWPARRIAHWRSLLVARAIENQFFMLGVNRIGIDGNQLAYEKSTMAVAPDGVLIEPLVAGEEMDIYDIDPEEAARYRAEFPTMRDKRYTLYRDLLGHIDAE